MRKTITFLIFALMILQLQAQTINQIGIDPDLDREILIGQVDETGLVNPIFVEDWQDRYDIYLPDKKTSKKLKKLIKKNPDITIKVFLATWCGDSKEHLPDFVKLVHQIKLVNISYYALNRQKEMDEFDDIDIYSFNIEKVPTFIVYRGDIEIGRIIETPEVSLEKDILGILSADL